MSWTAQEMCGCHRATHAEHGDSGQHSEPRAHDIHVMYRGYAAGNMHNWHTNGHTLQLTESLNEVTVCIVHTCICIYILSLEAVVFTCSYTLFYVRVPRTLGCMGRVG